MPKLLTSSKEKQNNFPEKAKLQQLISATIRWKSRESGRGKHALKHAGVRTRTHTDIHTHTRLNAGIHFLNPHSQIFTCLPGCLLHTNLHTHARLPRPAEFTHEGPEQTTTRPSPHSQTPPGWLSRGAGDALKERC